MGGGGSACPVFCLFVLLTQLPQLKKLVGLGQVLEF